MYAVNSNCTVLVSSCDHYEELWYPFFKILKVQWPDRPYPIVLNTESKSFNYEDMQIQTLHLYSPNTNVPWGARLINTLQHIPSEFIIFLLDDYFLLGPVNQRRIEQCIGWMNANRNIAAFYFKDQPGYNTRMQQYPGFERRPQYVEYKMSCQAAIWRREHLLKYIQPHESPWQWELEGSPRCGGFTEEFYCNVHEGPFVFIYDFLNCGLVRGRWTRSVIPLFERYNIFVDFSKKGFFN